MNDPIEDALNRLKPSELPPALMARLTTARPQARETAEEPSPSVGTAGWLDALRRWLVPVAVCAVAAVATVTWLNSSGVQPGGKSTNLVQGNDLTPGLPMESENRLIGAREVGIVVPPNRPPIRLMEVEWTESDTVRPRPGGDGLRTETTRRGILPMSLEVY